MNRPGTRVPAVPPCIVGPTLSALDQGFEAHVIVAGFIRTGCADHVLGPLPDNKNTHDAA